MQRGSKELMPVRYWFLLLFTIIGVIYMLAPIVIVVINSFNSVAYNVFPPEGFSLKWYVNLLQQSTFLGAAIKSIVLGVTSAFVSLVVGTLASYSLVRSPLARHEWIKSILLSPIVLPKMVLGVALFMFFSDIHVYGSFVSLILAHALISLPFVVSLISAALAGVDNALEEAAASLGATPLVTFFRVVLPQISVAMTVSGLFAFIVSFDQLESTIFLTQPGKTTLPIEMYDYTLKWQDPTVAALSSFIIAFSILLVFIISLLLKRTDVMGMLDRKQKGGEHDGK